MSAEGPRTFVDTNVLVYAHDRSAGARHDMARERIQALWDAGNGCLSIQVLQEFFVTITRKVPQPLDAAQAAEIVADLAAWDVHSPKADDVLDAIRVSRRHDVNFWDAMILVSAEALGCAVVWSEDLNSGQRYGQVEVQNPFGG